MEMDGKNEGKKEREERNQGWKADTVERKEQERKKGTRKKERSKKERKEKRGKGKGWTVDRKRRKKVWNIKGRRNVWRKTGMWKIRKQKIKQWKEETERNEIKKIKPKIKRITEQEQGQLIILAFWFLLACGNYSALESVWLDTTKHFELMQGTLLIQKYFQIGKPTSSAVRGTQW